MALSLHRRLARSLGYDLEKFNKQLTLASHLRRLLPLLEIDCVIDVGANVGQFAQLLRNEIGYTGRIISFEPQPQAFTQLRQAAAKDLTWDAYSLALSHRNGTQTLHRYTNDVFSSLHEIGSRSPTKFDRATAEVDTLEVSTIRLETWAERHLPLTNAKRVFLKMDTQGHDSWVFDGAGTFAERILALQSELSVIGIYKDVPDYLQMLQKYRDAGFELSGTYAVNRRRETAHLIEFDAVLVKAALLIPHD